MATRRHHRSEGVRVKRLVVVVVVVVLFLVRTMRAGRVVGAVRVGVNVWVWAVCAGSERVKPRGDWARGGLVPYCPVFAYA